jgi:hypothetical protein
MITFEVRLRVPPDRRPGFERAVHETYPRLLNPQEGFVDYRLLRPYDAEQVDAMSGTLDGHDYHLELTFTSESAGQAWIVSPEHHSSELAEVVGLASDASFCPFVVVDRFAADTDGSGGQQSPGALANGGSHA